MPSPGPVTRHEKWWVSRPAACAGCQVLQQIARATEETPEALFALFRDWQRTQTQSSATVLRSLRQQMDVRSCGSRDHQPRGTHAQADGRIRRKARSPERAQDSRAL